MNEGAILAARENRNEITQYDLIRSIEKGDARTRAPLARTQ
jgi:ATP-dependent Zn protease